MTVRTWRNIVVTVLLLASGTEFVVRGPLRVLRDGMGWNDFLSPYIQARAWVYGKDPYSAQSLVSLWPGDNQRPAWVDADATNGMLETKRGIPSPYPLPTLVVLSPLIAFPWPVAVTVWSLLNTAAVVLAAFALLSICGSSVGELRSQLFLAAVFALAPFHTGLATANPAVLAVSLTVGAHWAAHKNKDTAAGALLALAICVKPTVAGGLLLFYLVRRKWRIAAVACAIAAAIGLFGAARLFLAGMPWLSSYFENTSRIFSAGSMDDFTRANSLRFDMINTQVLIGGMIRNPALANVLSWFLSAGLLVWWLRECYHRRTQSGFLEISAVFVLSLIAVYHRFYDAALLIWPLAWSLLIVSTRKAATLTLAATLPFLLHGQVLLVELARSGRISPGIISSWWWNSVALPHEIWVLIFLAILLVRFVGRELPESSGSRADAGELAVNQTRA